MNTPFLIKICEHPLKIEKWKKNPVHSKIHAPTRHFIDKIHFLLSLQFFYPLQVFYNQFSCFGEMFVK